MGAMQRRKGATGEREFASLCRENGYDDVHRGRQYHGGADSPDVVGLPGVHVEVKRTEALSLYTAMWQAIKDAGENIPIVAHRRNDRGWLIVMCADDWFKLYREWEAGTAHDLTEQEGVNAKD